ncbi:MAG: hypothetical protein AB1758_25035 [Candidatus Eremiobacterota bacterium]
MRLKRLLAILAILLAAGAAWARPPSQGFTRVLPGPDGKPYLLETSITRYASSKGYTVDLVAVVHVGEGAYYEQLNQELTQYDAVLYEMVLGEDPRVKKRKEIAAMIGQRYEPPPPEISADPSGSETSVVQARLASLLGLEFQLGWVDYTAPNFVHADMTDEEFRKSMKQRGESPTAMLLKLIQDSFSSSSDVDDSELARVNLLRVITRGPTQEERYILRRVMAQGVGQMDREEGPDGSTLISARNQKALQVMEQQLKKGKKRLAIFYGAGHMPDFDRRLVEDYRMKREYQRWLTAWRLQP